MTGVTLQTGTVSAVDADGVKAVAYSGERVLKAGKPISFDFA